MHKKLLLPTFVLMTIIAAPTYAETQISSDEYQDAQKKAVALYQDMKLQEAQKAAQRALIIAEKQYGEERVHTAVALNNLGGIYYAQGEYDKAEPLFVRAVAIWDKQTKDYRKGNKTQVHPIAHLGAIYLEQKKYPEAETHLSRALELYEQLYEPGDLVTLVTMSKLGLVYGYQGNKAKAEELMRKALDNAKRYYGDGSQEATYMEEPLRIYFNTVQQ